jgi:Rap1a immunity proteins
VNIGANNVRRLLLGTIFSMIAIGQSLGAVTTITELTAKDLIDEYHAGNQQVLFYILGVGVGIIYSNGALQADKAHQLYCGPFEFSHEQLVDLMANFIAKHPEAGKISAANVLIISMQDAFPCH